MRLNTKKGFGITVLCCCLEFTSGLVLYNLKYGLVKTYPIVCFFYFSWIHKGTSGIKILLNLCAQSTKKNGIVLSLSDARFFMS